MDFTVVTEHFEIVVVLACLVVRYIVKKWVADVDNKYIPTICAILGAVLNCVVAGASVESFVYGAVAGLASTGAHQAFTQFVEGKKETE